MDFCKPTKTHELQVIDVIFCYRGKGKGGGGGGGGREAGRHQGRNVKGHGGRVSRREVSGTGLVPVFSPFLGEGESDFLS